MATHIFVTVDDLVALGWIRVGQNAHLRLVSGTIVSAREDAAPGVIVVIGFGTGGEQTRCQTIEQVNDLIRHL